MKSSTIILIVIVACLALCLVICVCMIFGAGLWAIWQQGEMPIAQASSPYLSTITNTPYVIRPTQNVGAPTESTEPVQQSTPVPSNPDPAATAMATQLPTILPEPSAAVGYAPVDTLNTLENTIVPINDPLDLAKRLEGKGELPRNLETLAVLFQVGDQRSFWVTDTDTNQNFQVQATLQYETEHVFFWIEDGIQYNKNHLKNLVETFENEIYPVNREFFGSEWTPGVDADPHLHILYARGLGGSVAGYFSTVDEYLPVVREDSNGHEMFLLSADHLGLDQEFTYGVLAHEFQHMIHWHQDRNEETWMNEGFSELAMLLNGYSVGGSDYLYTVDPDIQLTDWPTEPANRTAHYGASFLFMTYFLDRFGEGATQALVADPANGMVSIDQVLASLGVTDLLAGKTLQADDVFADWVVASYLQDPEVGDGRYTYHNYRFAPSPSETESLRSCPMGMVTRDVSQYGADYIHIQCRGNYTLHFEGSIQVGVLPVDSYSGSYAYYSNKGDESDMTLTRTFDFRNYHGPLTLTYWTWYDLEEDYDYLYLTASVDAENWQILITPSGTPEDPSGNSYGWGYNGSSGGAFGDPKWIQERVDISQFAGQEVQIRFEYVTDAAVNGEGFLLDDIAVPEIGYFDDFEEALAIGGSDWEAAGFVRIQNVLPQIFRLSLIRFGSGITVEYIDIPADNAVDIMLDFGGDLDEAILVVSGTTRFTRQKAAYRFEIR